MEISCHVESEAERLVSDSHEEGPKLSWDYMSEISKCNTGPITLLP